MPLPHVASGATSRRDKAIEFTGTIKEIRKAIEDRKNTTVTDKKNFSICISTDALAWLDEQAKERGISRSRLINEVVLLAKEENTELDDLRNANRDLADELKTKDKKFEELAKAAGQLSKVGLRVLKENERLEAENKRLRRIIREKIERESSAEYDDSRYFTADDEDDGAPD